MSDTLKRDAVIELLEKLGSERDEDVLTAARTLHTQITDSGMQWQDLLVTEDASTADADEEPEIADDDDESPPPIPQATGDESQTPSLLEKMLAREGNSEMFREELEEYKSDLANGELSAEDHRYIRALYNRLSKKG